MEYIKRILKAMIEARQKEVDRKITMMQLYSLTERELKDIGINRCDIRRIARDGL